MGIMHDSEPIPDIDQKFFIVKIQVEREFKKELRAAGFFKKPFVKWKMKKEIKRRQQEIYSDYIV